MIDMAFDFAQRLGVLQAVGFIIVVSVAIYVIKFFLNRG